MIKEKSRKECENNDCFSAVLEDMLRYSLPFDGTVAGGSLPLLGK